MYAHALLTIAILFVWWVAAAAFLIWFIDEDLY
jgi:hypothetical protein